MNRFPIILTCITGNTNHGHGQNTNRKNRKKNLTSEKKKSNVRDGSAWRATCAARFLRVIQTAVWTMRKTCTMDYENRCRLVPFWVVKSWKRCHSEAFGNPGGFRFNPSPVVCNERFTHQIKLGFICESVPICSTIHLLRPVKSSDFTGLFVSA